jgi:hypothetical protein
MKFIYQVLNKSLYNEKREINKICETINPSYTIFFCIYQEPKYNRWHEKHNTQIYSNYQYIYNYFFANPYH